MLVCLAGEPTVYCYVQPGSTILTGKILYDETMRPFRVKCASYFLLQMSDSTPETSALNSDNVTVFDVLVFLTHLETVPIE